MKKPGKGKVRPIAPIVPGAPDMPENPVSGFDPKGSWTGTPEDHGKPVQDADDL